MSPYGSVGRCRPPRCRIARERLAACNPPSRSPPRSRRSVAVPSFVATSSAASSASTTGLLPDHRSLTAPPEGEAPRRLYCQALRSRTASRLYRLRLASHPLDPEPSVPAAHIHGYGATSRFWTLQAGGSMTCSSPGDHWTPRPDASKITPDGFPRNWVVHPADQRLRTGELHFCAAHVTKHHSTCSVLPGNDSALGQLNSRLQPRNGYLFIGRALPQQFSQVLLFDSWCPITGIGKSAECHADVAP